MNSRRSADPRPQQRPPVHLKGGLPPLFNRVPFVRRHPAALVAATAALVALFVAPAAFAQTPAAGVPGQQTTPSFVTRAELDRTLARFATKAEVDELRAQLETLRTRLNELKTQVTNVKARLDGGEASVEAARRPVARDPKI